MRDGRVHPETRNADPIMTDLFVTTALELFAAGVALGLATHYGALIRQNGFHRP